MAKRLLIVEDDDAIARLLEDNLRYDGFIAERAGTVNEALWALDRFAPELVLLDLMLPGGDGFDLCRTITSRRQRPAIIILSVRSGKDDKVRGLDLGADDYVTKPFSPREVVLRIRAIMRRGDAKPDDERLTAGPITVDPARYEVSVNGKRINLTSLEFKLLRTLIQRRGRVQARDRLLNDVWGYESVIDTRTVDTHVRRLRKKLGKAADVIESVRGFGYRLREK